MSLVARDLRIRREGRQLLDGVDLHLEPGELHVVLGANGAGKSTLLHALAGDLRPAAGTVTLDGQPLHLMPVRALARRRAVLPQIDALDFAFTVREVVALGRYAAADDTDAIVAAALAATDTTALAERIYPTLSGGERSRVRLARALAQLWDVDDGAGRYLLLDEPTAALDLAHQQACMRIVTRFAAGGAAVLAVLHDPNLAMRYADRVSLLREGRLLASGPPREVLDAARLSAVYDTPLRVVDVAGLPVPLIIA